VSAFVERVNRLSAENSQKEATIADLTKTLEGKEELFSKIHAQAQSSATLLSSLEQVKTDLELELAGLQQELDKKDEEYETLRTEKQALKDDYQTMLDELQIHTGQSAQDEKKILELSKAKRDLEEVASVSDTPFHNKLSLFSVLEWLILYVIQANMEHIAALEENLRKFTENEVGVSSVLEENATLKEEQRQRQREQEAATRAAEELQQQLIQTRQRVQKLEEQLVIEKVWHFLFCFVFSLSDRVC